MAEVITELGLKMPAPEISTDEILRVVAVLTKGIMTREDGAEKREFWMTAEEITGALHELPSFERKVRKIASAAAPQIVSYPGSPGYKLWRLCTIDEINHCIDSIESQARDMMKRAILYRQAYHRRLRGFDNSSHREETANGAPFSQPISVPSSKSLASKP